MIIVNSETQIKQYYSTHNTSISDQHGRASDDTNIAHVNIVIIKEIGYDIVLLLLSTNNVIESCI